MKLDGTVVVISPGGALTSMGRVLALADLLESVVENVSVFTPDTGPLWPPSSRWDVEIRRGGRVVSTYAGIQPEVRWIWPVKPLRDCYRVARSLRKAFPAAHLIVDIDDDDEALTRDFLAERRFGRLRLLRKKQRRQLLPGAVSRSRECFLNEAAAFSTSSHALAERCGLPPAMTFRVIHPRSTVPGPRTRKTNSGGIVDLGFFGTVRPHKGIRTIAAVIESNPDFRLHVFAGYDPTGLESIRKQIVEHPVDGSRVRESDSVDAVLLPQERTPASEVQVPTKLIDAMRFGTPAFATPTTAIKEVGGETLHYLDTWADPKSTGKAIRHCLAKGGSSGDRARELFERKYSIEATAPALAGFLRTLDVQAEALAPRRRAARASASR